MNFKNKYIKINNINEFNLVLLILNSHNIVTIPIEEVYKLNRNPSPFFIYKFENQFSTYSGLENNLKEVNLTEYLLQDFLQEN